MNTAFFKKPVFSVDGFTLTVGAAILIAVVVYFLFLKKK